MNFSILPNLIALAVLVAVFWAISRKATTDRLYLWLAGWALVLLHFTAQFLSVGQGLWDELAATLSLCTLELASVAFLISVSSAASKRKQQITLALSTAIPVLAYTTGAIWGIGNSSFYYVVIAAAALAPLAWYWNQLGWCGLETVGLVIGVGLGATITAWTVARGTPEFGLTVLLAALNLAVAILYWNCYHRVTAGVVTAISGFALWAGVFPGAALVSVLAPHARIEAEVWNIPKYLVAMGMILTLLEDQIETSKYFAYHDDLTGLPNRRLLEDRLEQALAYARRTGSKVAVLQIDLDRFKEVNDTYGHRVGDVALREVAKRLATCIRRGDTLARSGGDEFTVISDVEARQAADLLVALLARALAQTIRIDGHEVQTGLSIGLALYPDDGSNADQLHAAADRAMYADKRAARNPLESASQVSV